MYSDFIKNAKKDSFPGKYGASPSQTESASMSRSVNSHTTMPEVCRNSLAKLGRCQPVT